MAQKKGSYQKDVRFFFDPDSPDEMAVKAFIERESRRLCGGSWVTYLTQLATAAMLGQQGDMVLAGLFLPPGRTLVEQGGAPPAPLASPLAETVPEPLPFQGNARLVLDDGEGAF